MDEHLLHAIHVHTLRHAELRAGHAAHEVFQTSTIAALLDGAYDGDVTIGELLAHGGLGLGTLDALDGELVVVDGAAYVADVDGSVRRVADDERTPFAVVADLDPAAPPSVLDGPLGLAALLAHIDAALGSAPVGAVRVDGRFAHVRARSVPRQRRPYRPLTEVVADQRVFELRDFAGTLTGFRFPASAGDVNVPGHHLHVIDAARTRGGHVLDLVLERGTLRVDASVDLHAELPAGVELGDVADPAAVHRIEG